MASSQKIVAFIVEQMQDAGTVSAKPMFGEYGIYCDGKMVALVCDDQLFVKPTAAGRALANQASEAPPYPGAKPCLLIDEDRWEDRDWLAKLIAIQVPSFRRRKPSRSVLAHHDDHVRPAARSGTA